jgi:hypothetical protein
MRASDETRTKIAALFEQFKPQLEQYHDYARRVTALSEEYHRARFAEVFPVPVEELTLLATIPSHETPKSLDEFLAKLASASVTVKKIIHDRKNYTYQIYV